LHNNDIPHQVALYHVKGLQGVWHKNCQVIQSWTQECITINAELCSVSSSFRIYFWRYLSKERNVFKM